MAEGRVSEYGLRDNECIWVSTMYVDHDASIATHQHPLAQIVWPERGQVTVAHRDRHWVVTPNQAMWISGDVAHELRALRSTVLHNIYLWDEEVDRPFRPIEALAVSGLGRELIRHLAREDLDDLEARQARSVLLRSLAPADASELTIALPRDARARQIGLAMMEDPAGTHRISDWSMRVHASEKTIQRAFLADTGMTFSEWRTQVRLFRALPLLAEQMPVSAVAARVGYASTNGFASAFRQHFGTTPATYFSA